MKVCCERHGSATRQGCKYCGLLFVLVSPLGSFCHRCTPTSQRSAIKCFQQMSLVINMSCESQYALGRMSAGFDFSA